MLAGTDKDEPCDSDPECAACLASKPAATPTPTPTKEPGFEAVFANFSFQKEKFIKENIVSSFGKAFL
jgi:hypothetical protein